MIRTIDASTPSRIANLFRSASSDFPTFDFATESDSRKVHHFTVRRCLGSGVSRFEECGNSLMAFSPFAGRMLSIWAESNEATEGLNVIVSLNIPLVKKLASCRVTNVVRSSSEVSFTYVTLSRHPEVGAETFKVELGPTGDVIFSVTTLLAPRGMRWTTKEYLFRRGSNLMNFYYTYHSRFGVAYK